jgi:creatinine amidohydrolase
MRTRFFDALTNREIEEYLGRSDIIFLPLGTAEMHGEMPVGCEHVLPIAFCLKMAAEVDGLVLPGLHYFYPGATAIGKGSIQVSPSVGAAYLKAICHSLLRQGFRRQVLVSAHGPAYGTSRLAGDLPGTPGSYSQGRYAQQAHPSRKALPVTPWREWR